MNAEPITITEPAARSVVGDLFHVTTCHDENLGCCGTDLTDSTWAPGPAPGEQWCSVCYDLDLGDCGPGTDYCGCLCCCDEASR